MAIIPRYNESQVAPNTLPTPQMSGASPVGEGLQRMGSALSGMGQEAFHLATQEKVKADSSAVMETQVSLNQKVLDLQTQALQRQGHDALDNKPMYDAFDKVYGEHQNLLKNDDQRRIFRMQTANERNQFQLSLERHAAEQGRQLNINNASALVETDMQKLSTMYRDPQAFEQQLKVAQAHKLDALHMMGLSDSDEKAKQELDKLKGEAWADRIRQTAMENPAEAKHLLEVHQDELEPKERKTLQHAVRLQSAEAKGRDTAFGMLSDIKAGASMTDLIQKGRSALEGDEEAFGKFQQQLEFLHTRYNQEKKEKIETFANSAYGVAIEFNAKNGRPMSPAEFAQTSEFKTMLSDPDAQKSALAALDKVTTGYRGWQSDQRKIAAEVRRNNIDAAKLVMEQRKEHQDKALADLFLNPDIVASMTDADLKTRYPELGHTNFVKAVEFKKSLSSPEKLADAKIDAYDFNSTLTKIGIDPKTKNKETQAKIAQMHSKLSDLIAAEQSREGRKLRRDEKQKLILDAVTTVPVAEHRTFFGFGAGYTTENKSLMDIEYKGNIQVPSSDRKTIVADFKTRFRRQPSENEIINAYIAKQRPE